MKIHTASLCFAALMCCISPQLWAELPQSFAVKNPLSFERPQTPVSWSIPFAVSDNLTDVQDLEIVQGNQVVPAQFTVLSRWGGTRDDISRPVRWVLADVQTHLPASTELDFTVRLANAGTDDSDAGDSGSSFSSPLTVLSDDPQSMVVNTGNARFRIDKQNFAIWQLVEQDSEWLVSKGLSGISVNGNITNPGVTLTPEHSGANRLSFLLVGELANGLDFTARLHLFRNLSEFHIEFRLENNNPVEMGEFGQPAAFDLTSGNSIIFDDISLVFSGDGSRDFQVAQNELPVSSGVYQQNLSLVQTSSGLENWDALMTEAPRQQAGAGQQRAQFVLDEQSGNSANQLRGWFRANGITLAVRKFWQNYPKAFRAAGNDLFLGLFPGEFAQDHVLRPGEYKTHTLFADFSASSDANASRAESFLQRPRFSLDIDALAQSRAAGVMASRSWTLGEENSTGLFTDYEQGIDFQMIPSTRPEYFTQEPFRSLPESIAEFNFYGWSDFGDLPLDFEISADQVAGPYGYKYDGLRGTIYQALRTDEQTWWELAEYGSLHTSDIDVHHTDVDDLSSPRGFWEGGIYGHQQHNERGNFNPHRNYMSPHLQTNYSASGLWLWSMLSGDTLVQQSAEEATQNTLWRIMNSDYLESDPVCARLSGLQRCDVNNYSCNASSDLAPGRGGSNVYKNGMEAWLATGNPEYLEVLRQSSSYMQCSEQEQNMWLSPDLSAACNRLHMQMLYYRDVAHYLYTLELLGLPDDGNARALLNRRIDYVLEFMWQEQDQGRGQMNMCYIPEENERGLYPYDDNWLITTADAIAMIARVLDRPELLDRIAIPTFRTGTEGLLQGGGGVPGYYWTKEYVNQVGSGLMFMGVMQEAQQNWVVDSGRFAVPDVFDRSQPPAPPEEGGGDGNGDDGNGGTGQQPPVDEEPPQADNSWPEVTVPEPEQNIPAEMLATRYINASDIGSWQDTFISALDYSTPSEREGNFGGNEGMLLYSEQSGDLRRGLIRFDVAALQLEDNWHRVILRLPILAGGATSTLLAPSVTDWVQGDCLDQYQCQQADGATWDNTGIVDALWQTPGGDLGDSAVQSRINDSWLEFDITSYVQAWLAGEANYGFVLGGGPAWSELILATTDNQVQQPQIAIEEIQVQSVTIQETGAADVTRDATISAIDWTAVPETQGNFGAAHGIWLYHDGEMAVRRGLLQFSLDALPQGAQIVSARVELSLIFGDTQHISLQRLVQPWQEGSCDSQYECVNDGANWAENIPGGHWQIPGAGNQNGAVAGERVDNLFSFDVTADVQLWIDNPDSNHGWSLLNEHAWSESLLVSSENSSVEARPRLVVSYIESN